MYLGPSITALEFDGDFRNVFELTWDTVVLLCSDGLTRHVSDERIARRLRETRSSKEACEALLADALEGGGSDNITIVVRRTVPRH